MPDKEKTGSVPGPTKPHIAYEALKVAKDTSILQDGAGPNGEAVAVPIKKGAKIIELRPHKQMKALADIDNLMSIAGELEAEIDKLSRYHYRCIAAMRTRTENGLTNR